jgi:signal transduction histidine kinase
MLCEDRSDSLVRNEEIARTEISPRTGSIDRLRYRSAHPSVDMNTRVQPDPLERPHPAMPRVREALYRGALRQVYTDDVFGPDHTREAVYVVLDRANGAYAGLVPGWVAPKNAPRTFAQLLARPAPCDPDTPLPQAWSALRQEAHGVLPVLDAQGAFLGVVTLDSVVATLFELLQIRRRGERKPPLRFVEVYKAARSVLQSLGHVEDEELLARRGLRLLMTLLAARYGAIGIVDEHGAMQRFLHEGLSAEQALRIGPPPEGKGLLGVVLREGVSLRIDDLGSDPRAAGLPPHHPAMKTLLAVPAVYGEEIIGRLYLCERRDGKPFSEDDEALAQAFAGELALMVVSQRRQREAGRARTETSRLLEENRRLARRLFQTQEEERRILARELHDELAQYVTAMHAETQRLLRLHGGTEPAVRESIGAMTSLCEHMHDLTQAVLRGLAPTLVYEAGLAAALKDLAQSFAHHHGRIRCRLKLSGPLERLETPVAIAAYRVVQEALTNAARHSAASWVFLGVRRSARAPAAGVLRILVRDNGRGFDPAAVTNAVGLIGMRERIQALNGTLSICSRPGFGTRIEALIPAAATTEPP